MLQHYPKFAKYACVESVVGKSRYSCDLLGFTLSLQTSQ